MEDSISNADTDQAEEQLYAAVDIDAADGHSDGELFIAVDLDEGAQIEAALSAVNSQVPRADTRLRHQAHVLPVSESSVSSQVRPPQESTVPTTCAPDMAQLASASTAAGAAGEETERIDDMVASERPQGGMNKSEAAATQLSNHRPTETEPSLESGRGFAKAPGTSIRTDPENRQQEEAGANDPPIGDASITSDAAPSLKDVSSTTQTHPSSTAQIAAVPSISAADQTARTDTALSTPGHGLNKVVERKEPAVLGDFVSLAEMEGRQHLRFNSKSPEKQPEESTTIEPVVEVTTQSGQSTPSKRTFTPFTSVIGGSAKPIPSPLSVPPTASTSRHPTSGTIAAPSFSPADNASTTSRGTSERRGKRSRDAASPPISTASETPVNSAAEDGGKKKKKKRKSKMAEEAEVAADGVGEKNGGANSDTVSGEKTLSASTSANAPVGETTETAAAGGKSRLDRASSGAIDMDIDEDPPHPVAQPTPAAKPNGTSTFNLDQEDFIAFDMSDDDDFGQKSIPPKNAFANKGKGKASNEPMCAECGGIGSHGTTCSHSAICASCQRTGHTAQYCFSSWRDYVYYTPEEREAAIATKSAIAQEGGWKYEAVGVVLSNGSVGRCYNCGDTGHWGDDCEYPRWDDGLNGNAGSSFSRRNAETGPFARKSANEEFAPEADPAFVQTQELEHESSANRALDLRPGRMGRERQKMNLRRQGGNVGNNREEEEEDTWFDNANRGAGNQGRFPGNGNRLGPPGPRNGGDGQNRRMAPMPNNAPRGIQIRGLASATIGGNANRNSNLPARPIDGMAGNRNSIQQGGRAGNAGNNGGRDYQRNDHDRAADNFYSSGNGGGSVAEWESDYRRSDQHFRPNQNAAAAPTMNDRFGNGRNGNVSGGGRGSTRPAQQANGGYGRNDPPQGRPYGGGQRQNYYGSY
ncbi:hypothetical protein QFC22_003815 [Naganishia vaughanmartiniae]|uniref:Uncharacterized protein n=1 Tax=Naganishia vaughanmartiniae TaxID=1424756 RepID=A0ACC2X4S9_9TREE|nr:hypothetical protein QFC22_003815 [Naganishia vaughanmartiniae]